MKNFILFVALVAVLSCVKKQEHKVEHPEWPRFDLGGFVVDTLTENPIEGAVLEIEYIEMTYPDTDSVFQDVAITDSSGFFVFNKIPMGVVDIHKYHPDFCAIAPDRIQLSYEDRYDLTLKMVQRNYYSIVGYVINSLSLTPIRGAEVKVIYQTKYCEDDTTSMIFTTITDINGFFHFENLPQGKGAVRAYRLAFFPQYKNFELFDSDMDTLYFYLVPIP